VSITDVVESTVGVAKALLRSRNPNVLVEVVFGAPAVGVKISASNALAIALAVPDRL
jgi:hypothetical protein